MLMITKLYRKYVPNAFRDKIYELFLGNFLHIKRNFSPIMRGKFTWFFRGLLPDTPQNQAYSFIGKHGITAYPFEFSLEYSDVDIDYSFDDPSGLPYIVHHGKKLFFPKNTIHAYSLKKYYQGILIEQDSRCAHRYVQSYDELQDKVLIDAGAAEGVFTLDVIEKVKHAYLIECEEPWIEALQQTFSPWKEKVTIVKKYLSDLNDEKNRSIDNLLENETIDDLFIKMDIEGAELSALKGAEKTLKKIKNISCSICTYHRKNDASQIKQFFEERGFETEFTDGFLFFEKDLRKAILRAGRSNQ